MSGHREWVGVRTVTGRVIHWYAGPTFDGARHLPGGVACGLGRAWMPLFAVDRDGGRFGPRLDDYCARCDAAVIDWANS